MAKEEPRGKVVEVVRMTAYGATFRLDSGVSVQIAFNNGHINLHFSGTVGRLTVQEAKMLGVELKLANYINVDYTPRTE